MLEDVLAALADAGLDRILVVTGDRAVSDLVARHGATIVDDPESAGHTQAVARGLGVAAELGASLILTVPGDVPCLTARDVRAIVRAAGAPPAAVFVPSRSGLGTNAACLAPPDAVPLRFGEPSFANHLAAARRAGVEPVVLELPGAALDLDHPEDLAHLHRQGPETRAAAVLRQGATPGTPPRPAGPSVERPAPGAFPRVELVGVEGLPEVRAGDDLAALLLEAARAQGTPIQSGLVVVVSQKVVSKAEGRVVTLDEVVPSPFALEVARAQKKDPRLIEVILRESRRVVRMDRGVLITETHHGQICANAGVDQSNVESGRVTLLPADPDAAARGLVEAFRRLDRQEVAVIIADTFGRPWREGLSNVAIGVAGMAPLRSYLGATDASGYTLQATVIAVADEIAAAAELVMGKLDRVPAALVRGYPYVARAGSAAELLRDPVLDLFR
jgi:coenzyme F420-0:L-glutamate ligase/coenzyme F420-1:gamma-L-glutamate ligase